MHSSPSSFSFLQRSAALFGLAVLSLLPVHHAAAGTPLICHPYDIGGAPTLPPGNGHLRVDPSYDRSRLTSDTLALLKSETPIIVRMETLRRAAIYATERFKDKGQPGAAENQKLANDLIDKLRARVQQSDEQGRAVALFDLGFFLETLRHARFDEKTSGYEYLTKAAEMRPTDADIQFALALASSWPRSKAEHSAYLAKARAGAKPNTLLASNLASHFAGH